MKGVWYHENIFIYIYINKTRITNRKTSWNSLHYVKFMKQLSFKTIFPKVHSHRGGKSLVNVTKVQGQKHPGRWGIVEHQIPSIKVLFKTNTKSHKRPGYKLLSESKTQMVNQRKQNSYRRAYIYIYTYTYMYIYINTELLDGNKGHQEETHHPTHRFRRLFLDLLSMGLKWCVIAHYFVGPIQRRGAWWCNLSWQTGTYIRSSYQSYVVSMV